MWLAIYSPFSFAQNLTIWDWESLTDWFRDWKGCLVRFVFLPSSDASIAFVFLQPFKTSWWSEVPCRQASRTRQIRTRSARRSSTAAAPALCSADVSANSDFSDPKFWISGGMVGWRVKSIYGHQFHESFQAFWARNKFLLNQSVFLPHGVPLRRCIKQNSELS